ncbi:protoporphyrinogen oxidase [Alloactinosynnema sp. L-07]|uniref:protoporphyrinogen oxidase n=1 Tax=Alloactinosynnema sp. L-07 TaxID=1653480 RepID=UPI0006B4C429|nr:protoporphyrinogen oxidase [Alloactinosynnema sp. L-07]
MRVAIVGGGISGLAAAHRLRDLLGPDAVITVVEQTDRLGGKLRTVDLAGIRYDVGAEAYLVRRPEAAALVAELGIEITHPTAARSTVRAGGVTRPIPGGTMLGIPASAGAVSDVLSEEGLRRVEAEPALPPLRLEGADLGLGALIRSRFGDELPDRLIDPLLGGVYAGGVDSLGLRATLPQLAAAIDGGATSLTAAAATVIGNPTGGPVFGTVPSGLSTLVDRLARDVDVRLGVPVRLLERTESGWRLTLGAAASGHEPADPVLDVDAVVLAVPPAAARRLLDGVVAVAAMAYSRIETASVGVVALALPPGTPLPDTSGVLVGAAERRGDGKPFAVKAFTYSATKWAHLDAVVVRGSVGRFGDPGALLADDDELVRLVRDDLAELAGVTAAPIDTLVTRWGGGLPQYGVGHVELARRIEEAVAAEPGLAVAGAALHGVGVPACIGTGEAAARRVAAHLHTLVAK